MGNLNSFDRGARLLVALSALLAGCALFGGGSPPAEETTEAQPTSMETTPETPVEPGEPVPAEPETAGDAVRLRADAPLRYVVKRGDTLWDISTQYLKDPWQWPELWYANPQVENPHLIYPGDELMLVWVEGAPRLIRDEPPREEAPPDVAVAPSREDAVQPQVRAQPLEQAVPTIPVEMIRGFLRGPRLVDKDDLDDAPYVLEFEDEHIIAGADSVVYVLNMNDRTRTRWQIVRLGAAYRDPDDGDVIGYEAIPVALTEVRAFGDPATVYVTSADIETKIGDHLLPLEDEAIPSRFYPHAPLSDVSGRVIAVFDGVTQIGQYMVVAINRGTEHGLEPGHVLSIIQSGRRARDPQSFFGSSVELPDSYAGTVMVFQTKPRVSFALVMSALRAVHVLDKVEKPGAVR